LKKGCATEIGSALQVSTIILDLRRVTEIDATGARVLADINGWLVTAIINQIRAFLLDALTPRIPIAMRFRSSASMYFRL
jgi:hypothetical protein